MDSQTHDDVASPADELLDADARRDLQKILADGNIVMNAIRARHGLLPVDWSTSNPSERQVKR